MKTISIKLSFWRRIAVLLGKPIRINFQQDIKSFGKNGNDFNINLNDALVLEKEQWKQLSLNQIHRIGKKNF